MEPTYETLGHVRDSWKARLIEAERQAAAYRESVGKVAVWAAEKRQEEADLFAFAERRRIAAYTQLEAARGPYTLSKAQDDFDVFSAIEAAAAAAESTLRGVLLKLQEEFPYLRPVFEPGDWERGEALYAERYDNS
jgi:hypothetical protein